MQRVKDEHDIWRARVNSRNQIVIPAEARKKLGIKPGDKLIIDVREHSLFVMREPDDYLEALREVSKDKWKDIDAYEWLQRERDAWEK